MLKKGLIRTALLSMAALTIGGGIAFYQIQNDTARVVNKASQVAPMAGGAQVGGPFELVDQNGQAVTQDNFTGKYKLIFFGFTYCPAVCPVELQKMARVLDELKNPNIQPLFISVDPERDTVDVVKNYVEQFHPDIVGLTGSREQVDKILENYKVYAAKIENEMMDGYMMDHSAFMYLMSPDDALITLYPAQDTAEKIAEDIKNRLNAS